MQLKLLPILLALLIAALQPGMPAQGQTSATEAGAGAESAGESGGENAGEALRGVVQRSPALPTGAVAGGAAQGAAPLSVPSTVASSLEGIRAQQAGGAANTAGAGTGTSVERTSAAIERSASPDAGAPPAASPPQPANANTEPSGSGATRDELKTLRRVLEDPEGRARLLGALAALEGLSAEGGAEGGETAGAPSGAGDTAEAEAEIAAGDAAAGGPPKLSLGRRIAEFTQAGVKDIIDTVHGFFTGVTATQRRLSGFADVDTERLTTIAFGIAITFISTFATFLALRIMARPIWSRLAQYADRGSYVRKLIVITLSALVDICVVLLAWAVGYGLAVFGWGSPGEIDLHEALFLNAFLVVELIKVAIRVLIARSTGRLRPLPLSDRAATYWHVWSTALVSLLGYGLMLVVPIVNEVVNIFTGRATAVLIFVAFLVISMILVLLNRKAPAAYFERRRAEEGGDVTLSVIAALAPFFPYAVIAYLFTLFVFAVANTGQVGTIVLDTLKVIGVIGLGSAAVSVLTAASRHGVQLPGKVTETLPLLERRLNTFVPAFLSVVRFVVFLAVIGAATEITGLFDVMGWLDATLGGDAASTFVSVLVIVLGAFIIWLAMSSWIEYRLTPRGYRITTSREQTLLTLLRNAATIAILVIATMFSLSELGINIAPLIASAGVFGLAIGFGAQKLVQDIITGVFIQFENACNVGDVITVGSTTGTVEKLTIRSVSLRDLQGTFHVIPFSSVDMVSNYMRGFAYHVADLGIAYREDTDAGKQVMLDCFKAMKEDPEWRGHIIGDLEWFGVQSLGDSAVVLRARIKARPGQQWGIGRRFNELLKKACDERGIEIPFPHMTVWMGEAKDGSAPPLHMRAEGGVAPHEPEEPSGPLLEVPVGTGRERTRKPGDDAPPET